MEKLREQPRKRDDRFTNKLSVWGKIRKKSIILLHKNFSQDSRKFFLIFDKKYDEIKMERKAQRKFAISSLPRFCRSHLDCKC